MKKRTLTLTLSAKQYSELEERAGKLSIQQYLIAKEFPNNDFNLWFPELIKRVDKLPAGIKFNLKIIMSTDWIGIPRGIKLALGRVFYKNVAEGNIENVVAIISEEAQIQWYIKK